MPQPRGQKRIPGHGKIMKYGLAACECGWITIQSISPTQALVARGRHLVDVRMAAAE
jgi:hypothetical protein